MTLIVGKIKRLIYLINNNDQNNCTDISSANAIQIQAVADLVKYVNHGLSQVGSHINTVERLGCSPINEFSMRSCIWDRVKLALMRGCHNLSTPFSCHHLINIMYLLHNRFISNLSRIIRLTCKLLWADKVTEKAALLIYIRTVLVKWNTISY